jgi:hypothetical protein
MGPTKRKKNQGLCGRLLQSMMSYSRPCRRSRKTPMNTNRAKQESVGVHLHHPWRLGGRRRQCLIHPRNISIRVVKNRRRDMICLSPSEVQDGLNSCQLTNWPGMLFGQPPPLWISPSKGQENCYFHLLLSSVDLPLQGISHLWKSFLFSTGSIQNPQGGEHGL